VLACVGDDRGHRVDVDRTDFDDAGGLAGLGVRLGLDGIG
jgi:hypothetical protein